MRYVRETYPQIEKDYIQTGQLRYAIFDLPLESIHSLAFRAAVATRCAGEQGKFWEMRNRLFANPQTLGDTVAHGQAVGLNQAKFYVCLGETRFPDEIRKDMELAASAGVRGTPSFMLATVEANGQLKVRRVMEGAPPYASFKTAIDALLAGR
ncbi:MAG: DsbA family protein [Bacteroidales bacterium]